MQKLSDNPTLRWTALGIVSTAMMMGYFFTDVMSPLEDLLTIDLGWKSSEYGFFSGAYGLINVFLLMLFFIVRHVQFVSSNFARFPPIKGS